MLQKIAQRNARLTIFVTRPTVMVIYAADLAAFLYAATRS